MLEDDDYSRRVRDAGYRLLCAEDAFVHHFGETSFGKLVPSGEYARVLQANRARFERSGRNPGEPYERRHSARYRELSERMRQAVDEAVPSGATVLVVSRGDEELLRVDGRTRGISRATRTAPTPVTTRPTATRRSRGSRRSALPGAEYIVFPGTGSGGWNTTRGFGEHLDVRYRADATPIPRRA